MPYVYTQLHVPDLIPLDPPEPLVFFPPVDEDELIQRIKDERLERLEEPYIKSREIVPNDNSRSDS